MRFALYTRPPQISRQEKQFRQKMTAENLNIIRKPRHWFNDHIDGILNRIADLKKKLIQHGIDI